MTAVLFDLDGVLADSQAPIAASVRAGLADLGHDPPPDAAIRAMIGPPIEIGLGAILGQPPSSAAVAEAVAAYRAHYVDGLRATRAYPGVAEAVRALGATRRLAVATSKPLVYAEPVLEAIGLRDAFDVVAGPVERGDQTKLLQVRAALDALGEPAAAMVGDRRFDMEAARACGLRAVGVLWGFGTEAELRAAGADVLVSTPADLLAELT